MRKISATQIATFFALLALIVTCAATSTAWLVTNIDLGRFYSIIYAISLAILIYVYALITFRLFLHLMPLNPGEIEANSRQEFVYHIYLLFFLILFYPVMRSGAVPVPLMRLIYLSLGAKLGENTYSSGIILDPIFVQVGHNSLIGQYALIIPHVIENEKLAHYPIQIGNNVTIGAHAVVLSDVTIGNGALIATGAVVKKGTHIGAGEIWGGVPARRLEGGVNEAEGIVNNPVPI